MTTNENELAARKLASAAVVVGTDGSEGANLAVRWAAELAARRGRRLLIVHGYDIDATRSVLNSYDTMNPAVQDGLRRRGDAVAAAARRLAEKAQPELTVDIEVSADSAARLLIRHSSTAHLVVLGATGMRGPLTHVGSTLLGVASHGHGAIVIVRGTDIDEQAALPVVVGVDGSPTSEAAVGAAFDEAAERHADLVALHTWSDVDEAIFYGAGIIVPTGPTKSAEEALIGEQLAGWHEKYPDVAVTRKTELSGPAKTLAEYSKSAQLVVVGSRGRGGFTGLLLGSTSNSLVQHAHCPVMVVHPD